MFVTLIVATTTDGFIAASAQQNSLEWTSKEDKQFFVAKTKEIGTMIMGWNTFQTIGKPLRGRRMIVLTDPSLLPKETLGESVTTTGTTEFLAAAPKDLLAKLAAEGVENVAICGGAYVYAQFMKLDLVDEIFMTVEPVTFGSGTPFVSGFDLNRLKRITEEPLGPALLQHYVRS